jgi:phage terminase large subunit
MIEVEIDKSVYLDCYHPIVKDNDIDIELIWGGRDSGKSRFVAQKLIDESLDATYFKAILVKKTATSIKEAQWDMCKNVTEQWGIEELFKFNSHPLEITCKSGSRFICRGMDEPGKIRSITNPSHVWIEEANQIDETDFITLLTSLRSDYGRVKLFLTFNPESTVPDYEEFWLYKMFFKGHTEKSFTSTITTKVTVKGKEEIVKLNYRSTHTTYLDNPFVTGQRIAFHESLKETNYYWYRVFSLGEWGNEENDNPWAFAYKREKHVSPIELNATRNEYLWLSFDFNRSPATCSVIQHYNETVYVIEVIKLYKSGTEAICDYILENYNNYIYIVTGDYSGNTPSSIFKEQVSNYTIIKKLLQINDGQIKVVPNPKLEKNQLLVNSILLKYKVQLCPVKAKGLIFDLEKVKKRADGTIVKNDRNDPAQQADALDTFRYFCNIELNWFIPFGE